jgi:DNA invertase Pin-like site-specific DNA recombinase
MNAGIYLRLSEAKETDEGTEAAYERFEAACRRLCKHRGWTVREVYREPVVTASKGRPRREFKRALQDLESSHIQALVAIKWARLSRNRKDTATLFDLVAERGVVVATADGQDTTTRAGRLALEIQAMLAREEAEETSERIRLQREHAAKKGLPQTGGKRTYGYTRGRTAIIEDEAAFIRGAAKMILAGKSVRAVTAWVNEQGSRTTTGREWQQATLRPLLINPALAGLRTYHGKVVAEGQWDPILSKETHERLCAILNDPARISRPGRQGRWLLSGLAKCSRCQQVLIIHYRPKSRGGGREYLCLPSPGRPSCGATSCTAEPLEQLVEEQVLQELVEGRLERALAAHGGQVAELSEQREAVKARLRTVRQWWNTGEIDDAEYREHRDELRTQLEEVQARLSRELAKSQLSELPTAEQELRHWWHHKAQLDEQRQVLKSVLSSVIVGPGSKRGGPRFQAQRIAPPWGIQWRI